MGIDMDKDARIKELEERVELLEEAVRIQNKVTEGSMESANYWRLQAMMLMHREAKRAFEGGSDAV